MKTPMGSTSIPFPTEHDTLQKYKDVCWEAFWVLRIKGVNRGNYCRNNMFLKKTKYYYSLTYGNKKYMYVNQKYIRQPKIYVRQPKIYVRQPKIYIRQPKIYVRQPKIYVRQPKIYVRQPKIYIRQPKIYVRQPKYV